MGLEPGQDLLHYRLVETLGAGGMGVVYRAHDSKLRRDVAIKVLPDTFAADRERLARFEREAHVLASLNHPGIASIYGLEDASGTRFLVLELVEGETLTEHLRAGPVAPREACTIALQIAAALEEAHARGVIHRDLKPDNIKITPEGKVKVLDFGLAKALEGDEAAADVSHSPTVTSRRTHTGVIMGTAAYMSPEQARGKGVDKRTDIWAFGCVLYEVLTATRAFAGETVSDIIVSILERTPNWTALPATVPARVRTLLERCLRKDTHDRLHDIADARIELQEILRDPEAFRAQQDASGVVPGAAASGTAASGAIASRRSWLGRTIAAFALVAAAAAGFAAGRLMMRDTKPLPRADAPIVRSSLLLPEGTYLSGFAPGNLALSPDGRKVALVAESHDDVQRLYLRHLDRDEYVLVPGSEAAENPFFSPDSKWLAYARGAISARTALAPELRKISVDGGLSQTICSVDDYFGGTWHEDGTIYFVSAHGLSRVPASGGEPVVIGSPGTEQTLWPQVLPGGKSLLTVGSRSIVIVDIETGAPRNLDLKASTAFYVPTGHLLYSTRARQLMGVRFDPIALKPLGTPVVLMQDLALARNAVATFSFSNHGDALFAIGALIHSGSERTKLVWMDRDGNTRTLPFELDNVLALNLSPDGQRVAVCMIHDPALWVYDLARGTRLRLPTGNLEGPGYPVWSPDGKRIAFVGFETTAGADAGYNIFVQSADGTTAPERLTTHPYEENMGCWTRDGETLLFMRYDDEVGIWSLDVGGDRKPRPFLTAGAQLGGPALSPDGNWLAYHSNESGEVEVYIQAYPDLGSKTPVSVDGGAAPMWSADGREIFFLQGRRYDWKQVLAAPVRTDPVLSIGRPRVVRELEDVRDFALAPNGDFLLLQRVPGSGIQTRVHLVQNWFQELERLVP